MPGKGNGLGKPPILVGYTYEPEEAYGARDAGRLLSLRLETSRACNLRCRYCYAESGEPLPAELDFDSLRRVTAEAAEMGARSVVIIGGGEPTIYPRFRELVEYAHSLGLIPVVFTNGMTMTPELAAFLLHHDASVMTKLDSFQPALQDFLAGRAGVFGRIWQGLQNLLEAGFAEVDDSRRLRLGVSVVTNSDNLAETADIWRFCRQRNIFLNQEVLTPTGRAKRELPDKLVSDEEIRANREHLLEIDRREFGFDWLPYTPLPASGCLQHLYSLYVTVEGNVRPCAPTKFDENPDLREGGRYPHNIRHRSLREIYHSELFDYVRHIDRHLEGKCAGCEHNGECLGCRGFAYSEGVNAGLDPLAALRSSYSLCFKKPS
ncbi:MAG: radical SAM protein [Pseudomonadota bacterium]